MDDADRLRALASNDRLLAATVAGGSDADASCDATTLALVHLAALVACGGAVPSYAGLVAAALEAGATDAEIVDVLVHVIPVVGLPRVVGEAPKLGLALGYDTDEALEDPSGL